MAARDESLREKRARTKYGSRLSGQPPGGESGQSEPSDEDAGQAPAVSLENLSVTVTDRSQTPAERYTAHVTLTESRGPVVASVEREHRLAESTQWDPDGYVAWNDLRLLVRHRIAERLAGVERPDKLRPDTAKMDQ